MALPVRHSGGGAGVEGGEGTRRGAACGRLGVRGAGPRGPGPVGSRLL